MPGDSGLGQYDQPAIGDFVLYAEHRLSVGAGNRVAGGHIGVRSMAAGQRGDQLVVGAGSVIEPGRVIVSPSVTFGRDVSCGTVLADAAAGPAGPQQPERLFPIALMPPLPLALAPAPAAGTEDVTVPTGQEQSLDPGSYGALTVNGSLMLDSGDYVFASIEVGDGARLASAGTVRIIAAAEIEDAVGDSQ
jgi:hypothetical protein